MLLGGRLMVSGVRQVVVRGVVGAGGGGRQVNQVSSRTITSTLQPPYTLPNTPWGQNRAARLELAAAYRALDMLGLNEGVCNHLSVMAPKADGSGENTMLVVNYGLQWSEVKASELVGVDNEAKLVEGEGKPDIAASCIHLGIRDVRPDAKVIMHTHQPYATALACLKDPTLLMVHQNSARFFQRVAYDNCYSGIALAMDEGRRLGKVLGDKDVLMMGNHGVVVVAPTVAMAFDNIYYLERAAMFQVLALSTQKDVLEIPEAEAKKTSGDIWRYIDHYSKANFYGTYRKLRQSQPDFEH